jgi:hypothetical protein
MRGATGGTAGRWTRRRPRADSVRHRVRTGCTSPSLCPTGRAAVVSTLAGGATMVAERDLSQFGSDFVWTVLADPEGNQFCVAELEGS